MPTYSSVDKSIGIIGLGYVGLPLALSFVEAGLNVVGMDSNERRVEQLVNGESPIEDITNERLGKALGRGLRIEGPSSRMVASLDALFVCVPTPVDRANIPDLGPVLSAAAAIQKGLRPGQLIVLQSTTFPGTTAGPFRTELERDGLVAGRDFDLAFAPERMNPGDPASASREVPRLVGGTTARATERAAVLLERVSRSVVRLSSPDAAELAKLLENVFRNVNIALVNQLSLLCERMGIDVWEVIDAASTKPFGFMRFTPGPGVGGHCIPVDPYYLSWRARQFDFVDRFIETAGDINLAMPRHVVDLIGLALNDRQRSLRSARVGVVGVAFKPNVRDTRNSPAAAVMSLLVERGAEPQYHDPHVTTFADADGREYHSLPLESLLLDSHVIVIITPHAAVDWGALFAAADLIVDTVNASKHHRPAPRQVLRLGAGWS